MFVFAGTQFRQVSTLTRKDNFCLESGQQAIGVAVVGGMIAATVMSLLFTPVFYVLMQRLSGLWGKSKEKEKASLPEQSPETV